MSCTSVPGTAGGPGLILVLFPWLITRFQTGAKPGPLAVRALGVALIVLAAHHDIAPNIVTSGRRRSRAQQAPPRARWQ